MKIKEFIPGLFALVAGIVGFFLRRVELNTVFDAQTGLAARGAPISIALMCLSTVVLIILLVLSRRICACMTGAGEDTGGVAACRTLCLIFAIGIALGGILYWVTGVYKTSLMLAFSLFALCSGIGMAFYAISPDEGTNGNKGLVFGIIPPLFFSLWLIIVYITYAKNPVKQEYLYISLAIAASAMSYYYQGGYVFNISKPARTLFTECASIYLTVVSLADEMNAWLKLILVCVVGWMLLSSAQLKSRAVKADDEADVVSSAETSDINEEKE
ncbi:MAG: hypothetical protein IJG63_02835 [Oscillospiraceae bacterium]|nr:hypothetical protein [Oscillospiraceae bacterium]